MYKRDQYMSKLIEYKDSEFIKVITGVRRSGKSFLLKLFKEHLLETEEAQNIIFINFEDPEYFELSNHKSLYAYIKEQVNDVEGKVYFLFDEIQEVEGWQKLINGLRVVFECDIYITGSNASL